MINYNLISFNINVHLEYIILRSIIHYYVKSITAINHLL